MIRSAVDWNKRSIMTTVRIRLAYILCFSFSNTLDFGENINFMLNTNVKMGVYLLPIERE
jgi:hypothetical protein